MDKRFTDTDTTYIDNEDVITLSNIWYLMRDITNLEERRAWQEGRMYHMTQHLSNGPGGGSGGKTKGLEETFAALAELDEEHEKECADYVKEMKKAQKILNKIKSKSMKTFVTMLYMMNRPFSEIRKELNMTRRMFYAAKLAVEGAPNMESVEWKDKFILRKDKNVLK